MHPVQEMTGWFVRVAADDDELLCGDFWDLAELEGAPWEPQLWVVPGHTAPWSGKYADLPKHHAVLQTQCDFTLMWVNSSAWKLLRDNFEITTNPNDWAHYELVTIPWYCRQNKAGEHTPRTAPNYPATRFICRRSYHQRDYPKHPERPMLYMDICDWGTLFGRVCPDGTIDEL